MLWPSRNEIEQLDLIPPLVAVDGLRLRQMVDELSDQHRRQNVTWRPVSPASLFPPLIKVLKDRREPVRVCFGGIQELVTFEPVDIASALLFSPPVVGSGPRLVASLARHRDITVVCDHFAQVERLAAACRSAGSMLTIRLRIDVGLGRVGVRPGPDLDELIRGVLPLETVRLDGLLFPSCTGSLFEAGSSALSAVVERSCSILSRYELPGQTVSVGHIDDVPSIPDIAGNCIEARTTCCWSGDSPAAILAGVVGRPTRDQVVIDVGRGVLGEGAIVADERRHDLKVRWVGDDSAVLQLTTERHDIAIGDVLPLFPCNFRQVPLLAMVFRTETGWQSLA